MYNAKLIYDVGMYNGDDTAFYLSEGYLVVAIEADPGLAEKAKERFKTYINQGRLKILNVGVAAEEGLLEFYINEVQPVWNSFDLSIASRDGLPWHAITIDTKTFSQIIAEHGVPYYLKVDIEGHDYLCVGGLDNQNLPRYISVEANNPELVDQLSEKGFSKFKLILQYNLAHLDLPPNKYFRRWLFGFRFRQWNSFPVKVFRKLGGSRFITWYDQTAIPPYSKGFNKGSSGNFGENLGGKWVDKNKALEIYHYYDQLFHQLPNSKEYGFWADIHATW